MSKRQPRRKAVRNPPGPSPESRERYKRELARAVKIEKTIQKLARALEREIDRTDDALQLLAVVLGSRARAIQADQESVAALQG